MGWDFSFAHMVYGDRWKKHRRVFHHQFQPSIAPSYYPIQTREAHGLLRRFLRSPDTLDYNLRQSVFFRFYLILKFCCWLYSVDRNAASLVMKVTYGIQIADTNDAYVAIAGKALEGAAMATSPGAFLVDFIPFRECSIFHREVGRVTDLNSKPVKHVPYVSKVPGYWDYLLTVEFNSVNGYLVRPLNEGPGNGGMQSLIWGTILSTQSSMKWYISSRLLSYGLILKDMTEIWNCSSFVCFQFAQWHGVQGKCHGRGCEPHKELRCFGLCW